MPALSVAGASIALPCSVSTPRSSNPAGDFLAPGSRTRKHRANQAPWVAAFGSSTFSAGGSWARHSPCPFPRRATSLNSGPPGRAWCADFRVRWLFRRFRGGPQSGSHGYVSSTALKFRTGGFPQYGFKPKPLNPDLPDRPPGLSATSACPRPSPGLTGPSSPGDPPAFVVGVISQPASGRTGDRLGPRVLCSARFCYPRISATTTRSAIRRLPRISQWAGYTGALRPTTRVASSEIVLTLSHPPFPACRYPYAGGNEGLCPEFPHRWPSPREVGLGSLVCPAPGFMAGPLFDASVFALCCGPQSGSPLHHNPPSRGGRDFYVRAFPARVPGARSDMTTQPTGLVLRWDSHPLGECCVGCNFPPPELPGFLGTTSLSATPGGPACPSRASGWESRFPPMGLPVLQQLPVCRHAVTITPVGPLDQIVRDEGLSTPRFSPATAAFPDIYGGSAPTLKLSRPARCSLALRPADSPHR